MPMHDRRLRTPTAVTTAITVAIAVTIAAVAALIPLPASAAQTLPAADRIHARAQADVTGDGVDDSILLVGHPYGSDSQFCTSHDVVVYDGVTQDRITMVLGGTSGGYPGTIFVGRIDNDNALDVVVTIPTGGSGGITNPFVVSFAGGKARFIGDPQAMARGAKLEANGLDHFRVRITDTERGKHFILGLPGPGSAQDPELDYYDGIYSKSGKLIRPLDIDIDDVGAIEAASIPGTGLDELVTYQKVWAVAHVNTIGTVRTVWRWTGRQIAIAAVDVIPPFTPEAYGEYIRSFDKSRPAAAVEKAVAEYKARFGLAPLSIREMAFREFRHFHLTIAAAEGASLEKRAGLADAPKSGEVASAYERLPRLASELNMSDEYKRAGLNAVYDGEGTWTVVPRPGFSVEQFGRLLPQAAADFVGLDDRERNERWQYDAAIVVPLSELGGRVAAWEAYLAKYPDSMFADEARTYFKRGLSALLMGTNNTPHFNYGTKRVRPDVIDALKAYAKDYSGTPSAEAVTRALKAIEKNGNVITDAVRREINRAIEQATKADAGQA